MRLKWSSFPEKPITEANYFLKVYYSPDCRYKFNFLSFSIPFLKYSIRIVRLKASGSVSQALQLSSMIFIKQHMPCLSHSYLQTSQPSSRWQGSQKFRIFQMRAVQLARNCYSSKSGSNASCWQFSSLQSMKQSQKYSSLPDGQNPFKIRLYSSHRLYHYQLQSLVSWQYYTGQTSTNMLESQSGLISHVFYGQVYSGTFSTSNLTGFFSAKYLPYFLTLGCWLYSYRCFCHYQGLQPQYFLFSLD